MVLVANIFRSIQGEGFNAGALAVFVRLAGCNMWNGLEPGRDKGQAVCSRWCDTDFLATGRATIDELLEQVECLLPADLVILTGGEPLLQVDEDVVCAVKGAFPKQMLCVETNGTRSVPKGIDWVTVSPKVAEHALQVTAGDELKVVYPDYDPEAYSNVRKQFRHAYISPRWGTHLGEDIFKHLEQGWRVTTQAHKTWGVE